MGKSDDNGQLFGRSQRGIFQFINLLDLVQLPDI